MAVRARGVCATDLKSVQGRVAAGVPPRTLGHGVAGEIAALGSAVAEWSVGERD